MNIKTECGSYLAPENCNREQAQAIANIMLNWNAIEQHIRYQERVYEIIDFNTSFMAKKGEDHGKRHTETQIQRI